MRHIKSYVGFLLAGAAFVGADMLVYAQDAMTPPDWPYPADMDGVKSSPANYKVRFENDKIRLVEVTIRPGETEKVHGDPYTSVIWHDSPTPKITEKEADPQSTLNGQGGGYGPSPKGFDFPTCATSAPRAPYAITNTDTFPMHFYRLDFKRIDGDGIKTKWKEWYPWMLKPIAPIKEYVLGPELGPPLKPGWPYPAALESYKSAPNQHQVHYMDEHVQFFEVTTRPGERGALHGHPQPSGFANDSPRPPSADPDEPLDPNSPFNTQNMGRGAAPTGLRWPTCSTMPQEAPHRAHNTKGEWPIHFYRLEFRRIDGDDIKTKGREWYP